MANEYVRKQYVGGAAQTEIVSGINDTDTTITILSAAGWPSGSDPFVVTLDVNETNEETLLVTRSGTTLTVVERGYDGTAASAHTTGATCIHTFDAHSADQANRLANLQEAKGDLIVHNGTNPALLDAGLAGDGSDDGKIIRSLDSAGTGWQVAYPATVTADPSAPAATSATPYGLWADETQRMIRWLDSSWQLPNQLLVLADVTALDAAVAAPVEGQAASLYNGRVVVVYNDTAAGWVSVGVATFADDTARDAFYAESSIALVDGSIAKTLDDSHLFEYRSSEWVRINQKITISANAPSSPDDGDVWLQPLS